MNVRTYSTSEVAKIIGIHPNTVRLYEEWGMITPSTRKSNGYTDEEANEDENI